MSRAIAVVALLLFAVAPALAEQGSPPSDGPLEHPHPQHPPAGIAAGHTLHAGRFAIGYSYQTTRFDDLRDRRDKLSATELLATSGYQSAPKRVEMERHDIALMYAPTDRVTLMAMLPIHRKKMRNETRTGVFTTRSSGVGDLTFTAIARFMEKDLQQTWFHVELGTPTGSIRERDGTPFGNERLPYPMQLGTGVWHLSPGLSYRGQHQNYTWGGQATTLFRFGENDLGYRPGNDYKVTAWAGRAWLDDLKTSLRIEWRRWENVSGFDPQLDPTSTPVNDSYAQKGTRLDFGFGLDVGVPRFDSQSFEVEATIPIWEKLDGPQPSFDWQIRAGWRWAI